MKRMNLEKTAVPTQYLNIFNNGTATTHSLLRSNYTEFQNDVIISSIADENEAIRFNTFPIVKAFDDYTRIQLLELSALYGASICANILTEEEIIRYAPRLINVRYKIAFMRGVAPARLNNRILPTNNFPDRIRCEIKGSRLLNPTNQYDLLKGISKVAQFRAHCQVRDIVMRYMCMPAEMLSNIDVNWSDLQFAKGVCKGQIDRIKDNEFLALRDNGAWMKMYSYANDYIRDNYLEVANMLKIFEPERLYGLFAFPELNNLADVNQFIGDIYHNDWAIKLIDFDIIIPRAIKWLSGKKKHYDVGHLKLFQSGDADFYKISRSFSKPKDFNGLTTADALDDVVTQNLLEYMLKNRISITNLDAPMYILASVLGKENELREYTSINDVIIDDIMYEGDKKDFIDKHLKETWGYDIVHQGTNIKLCHRDLGGIKMTHLALRKYIGSQAAQMYGVQRVYDENQPVFDMFRGEEMLTLYVDCDNCSALQFIIYIEKLWKLRKLLVDKGESVCKVRIKYILNQGRCAFWDALAEQSIYNIKTSIVSPRTAQHTLKSNADMTLALEVYRDVVQGKTGKCAIMSNDSDFFTCADYVVGDVQGTLSPDKFFILHTGYRVKCTYKDGLTKMDIGTINMSALVPDVWSTDKLPCLIAVLVKAHLLVLQETYTQLDKLVEYALRQFVQSHTISFEISYVKELINDMLGSVREGNSPLVSVSKLLTHLKGKYIQF